MASIFDQARQTLQNLKNKVTKPIVSPIPSKQVAMPQRTLFQQFASSPVGRGVSSFQEKMYPFLPSPQDPAGFTQPFKNIVGNIQALSTPEGTERWLQGFNPGTPNKPNYAQIAAGALIDKGGTAGSFQIPTNIQRTFGGGGPRLMERGANALGLVGNTVGLVLPGIDDALNAGYQYVKGTGQAARQGKTAQEARFEGLKTLAGQKRVGAGDALTDNPTLAAIGNVLELPLMLFGGYKMNKMAAESTVKNTLAENLKRINPNLDQKQAIQLASEFWNNEYKIIRNKIGQFAKQGKDLQIQSTGKPEPVYYSQLRESLGYLKDNYGNIRVRWHNPQTGQMEYMTTNEWMKSVKSDKGGFVRLPGGKDAEYLKQKGITQTEADQALKQGQANIAQGSVSDINAPKINKGIDLQKPVTPNLPGETGLLNQTTMEAASPTVLAPKKSILPNQTGTGTTLPDVSSTDILPQKGKLNVQKLNLPDESKQVVRASNQVEPTVIGNKAVIETSKLTTGARGAMSDAQQQKILGARLNSRQEVVTLTKQFEELKRSGADEKTLIAKFNEIADQSHIAQQEGTFAGRQLQAQKILADELATPQQKILALLENAGIDKEKYAKDAINVDWNNSKQVVDFYRKYVPPKFGDILTEFRYTNMLSSPLTHIVNTATNLFQSGVIAPIEKTITGQLDWVKSTITGSERQYYASDGIEYAKGFYSSLPNAWTAFKDTLSGKKISIKPDMERIPVSTGGLYRAYTTPLNALEAADKFFMELVKGGESASLKNKGLSEAAIAMKAENSAQYRLFRQQFDPSGKAGQGYVLRVWDQYNSVVNQLRRLPGGRWIVPFLQTPTNILKQGFEYSPLGITTLPGSKAPLEQLSKTIIGTTVFAGAYGLLNSVPFTWDVPTGNKERDLFYAAGMQPYSVKIGDKWVSYSKLGPLAYPIAMAAALRYAEKYDLPTDKENAISTAVGGMLKFFSDQSYVKQLGDFIDSVQTGKGIVGGLKMEATNSISQLIPYKSFLGWMSRIIDPVSRKSTDVVSSITSQLPVLSKTVEPYYNPVTGKPSERSNPILNSFSPVRLSTGDSGIEKMYDYTGSGKRAYANLKRLPPQEAAVMFNKIKQQSPAIAKEIIKIDQDVKLGITGEDKAFLNMDTKSGERAYALLGKFNKLQSKEEKTALWEKYTKAKIITPEVAKQLIYLLQKK